MRQYFTTVYNQNKRLEKLRQFELQFEFVITQIWFVCVLRLSLLFFRPPVSTDYLPVLPTDHCPLSWLVRSYSLPRRHGGSYYGPVGLSLKPLRGEKGGSWCSIRSSPPLLPALRGSLTGRIIPGTCQADWQLNESSSARLLQAPFHGFSLCMTNPLHRPISPLLPPPNPPSFIFLSTTPPSLTTVLPLLSLLVWSGIQFRNYE